MNSSAKSFADRSYFREALATGDFALSDYIIGRVTGKPVIVLALPRMHERRRRDRADRVDRSRMDEPIAAETGSNLGAEVLLMDKGATVLAAYPDPKAWVGRNLAGETRFISSLKETRQRERFRAASTARTTSSAMRGCATPMRCLR